MSDETNHEDMLEIARRLVDGWEEIERTRNTMRRSRWAILLGRHERLKQAKALALARALISTSEALEHARSVLNKQVT